MRNCTAIICIRFVGVNFSESQGFGKPPSGGPYLQWPYHFALTGKLLRTVIVIFMPVTGQLEDTP